MYPAYEIIFSGRVQGVGFRYLCQQIAIQLKLVGNVRNLSQGDVKVILQTNESTCQLFIQAVQSQKHPFIQLQHIKLSPIQTAQLYKTFDIVY